MTLYKHVFTGMCAAGDQFNYGWYANSLRTLAAAQTAALAWNSTLWNGAVAGNGYQDHCSTDVAVTQVKTVEIDPATGKQLALAVDGQSISGASAAFAMPADSALVVSLRTAFPQRSGRGRFYLPQPSIDSISSTGRVLADVINDTIASLTAAWTAYNSGVERPVIYSPTFRLTRNVTNFDIGDLFDTQRRRENKLTEARTTAGMP